MFGLIGIKLYIALAAITIMMAAAIYHMKAEMEALGIETSPPAHVKHTPSASLRSFAEQERAYGR